MHFLAVTLSSTSVTTWIAVNAAALIAFVTLFVKKASAVEAILVDAYRALKALFNKQPAPPTPALDKAAAKVDAKRKK
jgi:hypothetical protein